MQKNQTKPRHSRTVRIVALVLSILVTGSALTALITMLVNLFS